MRCFFLYALSIFIASCVAVPVPEAAFHKGVQEAVNANLTTHVLGRRRKDDRRRRKNPPGPAPGPPSPPSPPSPGPKPVYDGALRDEGDGLTTAYMVPAGTDNHASTIESLPDGSLVAAWFAGDHEEAPNCAIAVSRLSKNSTQWTKSQILATTRNPKTASQNPLLFFDHTTGTLHLWHTKAPHDSGESEAEIYHLSSKDGGLNWSDSKKYLGLKGVFTRNRIIRRTDGTLFWPFYSTNGGGVVNGKVPMFAWSKSKSVPESGDGWTTKLLDQGDAELEQPTCWYQPHAPKTLECYFRDCNSEHIYHSESNDDGKSFSKPKPTRLPNPGSGIEGFPLKNGDIVLMFNPTTKGRDPLSAGISKDDGDHWTQRLMQNGPTGVPNTGKNEFSYPTVIQTDDGSIHTMYSYNPGAQTRTIKYVRFTEDWVTKNATLLY